MSSQTPGPPTSVLPPFTHPLLLLLSPLSLTLRPPTLRLPLAGRRCRPTPPPRPPTSVSGLPSTHHPPPPTCRQCRPHPAAGLLARDSPTPRPMGPPTTVNGFSPTLILNMIPTPPSSQSIHTTRLVFHQLLTSPSLFPSAPSSSPHVSTFFAHRPATCPVFCSSSRLVPTLRLFLQSPRIHTREQHQLSSTHRLFPPFTA